MINVNLYTADPTGEHGEYRDAVYQYAENMNRMYQLFHVSFHVVEYSGKLTKDRDGKFQVKKMQNAVLPAIRTSDICQLIFLCRVTEIARPELDQLMENLTRQKRMAFQAWFINDQGLRQVFAGISGVVAQINARTAFDTEELGQMEAAGSMLDGGLYAVTRVACWTAGSNRKHMLHARARAQRAAPSPSPAARSRRTKAAITASSRKPPIP